MSLEVYTEKTVAFDDFSKFEKTVEDSDVDELSLDSSSDESE